MRDILLRHIDGRLSRMLQTPEMWGSSESLELQVLQLLELRLLVVAAPAPPSTRQVFNSYVRFVVDHFPGETPETLSALLTRHDRAGEFVDLIGQFIKLQKSRQDQPIAERRRGISVLGRDPSTFPSKGLGRLAS